jgi:hypothetical protein
LLIKICIPLGALPGRPDSRKILKMSNLHLGMSGVYKVVTKAQFCEFPKEILVDVYGKFFVEVLNPNIFIYFLFI